MKKRNSGIITEVKDGIAIANGLSEAGIGEVVEIVSENGSSIQALVMNLDLNSCSMIILGDQLEMKSGQMVYTMGNLPSINVSNSFKGRVVNALGKPIDGLGDIELNDGKEMLLEKVAPGVLKRKDVKRPLQTGIVSVDAMIPIGRGQRELIIGDRQTGKTAVAIDTLINQKDKNCIGIYVSIGQKASKLNQIISTFKTHGAFENIIIVAATADEAASMQYLSAFTGTAIGEYFSEQGQDAVVVYDDLTKHAQSYRQISLLLKRPSGREAYPGDIFYLHSRILERAVQYSDENGGGSLTALPIIETQAGDVSAYIPTNVISITDGQIFLDSNLFNSGTRPAIDIGISVSRVGGDAQTPGMKSVAGQMKLDLAQFRELAVFAQFGSDLDKETKEKLERGQRSIEVLKQDLNESRTIPQMIALIYAATRGLIDKLKINEISEWKEVLLEKINNSEIASLLDGQQKIKDEIEEKLAEFIKKSVEDFIAIRE